VTENKQSFKQSLEELQGIVNGLESGSLELEDSLAAYKRGVELIEGLNRKLDEAKQQVEVLMGEVNAQRLSELATSDESKVVTQL